MLFHRLQEPPSTPPAYSREGVSLPAISYDIYLAEHYRRQPPSPPDYRLLLQQAAQPLPSYKQLALLDKELPDKVLTCSSYFPALSLAPCLAIAPTSSGTSPSSPSQWL